MAQFNQRLILLLSGLVLLTTACQKQSFERVVSMCEAPNNSARVGAGAGPLITDPAPQALVSGVVTLKGSCVDGTPVTIVNDAGTSVQATCENESFEAEVNLTGPDGLKALSVTQNTNAGAMEDRLCYMKDATPPAVTINNGHSAQSFNEPITTISGTCESGLPVEISGPGIVAPVETTCTNGTFTAPVQTIPGQGIKEIIATQKDPLGNEGKDNASFLIDTLAPVVVITSPAVNTSSNNSLTVTGTCEPGLTVGIGEPTAPTGIRANCPAGNFSVVVPLVGADGPVPVKAYQVDHAGNIGENTRQFIKDTVAPNVTINLPLADSNLSSPSTFSGNCESGISVQLSGTVVASAQTVACTNGAWTLTTAVNGQGPKTLVASQTDAAGNTGSAQRNYQSDNSAPVLAFTSPAAGSYVGATAVIQGTCESGLTVQISGSGVSSSTSASCTNGTFSSQVTISAQDGAKPVTISQTDTAGNTGTASRSFVRDTTPPVLSITSPVEGSYIGSTTTLIGTCEAGLVVTISGSGVSSNSSVTCASNGSFTVNLPVSAGEGTKTFTATETDAAGNTSQVSKNYMKDTLAPVVAILSPATNTQAQNGLTVSGSCEAGLPVTISGSGVSSSVQATCSNGSFSAAIVFSANDGSKSIVASQTDAAGNTGSDSETYIKNNTAPTITITSPAANSYLGNSFTLQGNCQAGLQVVISGSGIASGTTVACAAGTYSATLSPSAGDGIKTVTASQTDAANNTGSASRNFQRDSTAPAIAFTSPAANSSVPISTTLTGTCETGLGVTITGDLTSGTSVTCSNGTFSANVTFSAGLGSKNVQASQTDIAGNTGTATRSFSRDTNAGVENFVADASFGQIDILFVDDNSASMDPQQASLGAKFSGFSSELQNIDWQIGITTTDCSNGPYGICGSLLPMTGTSTDILTKTVPNYQTVFNNTIKRPETAGCLDTGTCPAGNSQPLLSATTAMTKHNTDNNGFFRADSALAIVILSDADEGQNSPAQYSNRPAELVSTFNSIWPSGKKLSVYSIIVKPGDSACLSQLTAQNGGFSFYGNFIDQTVSMTSGISTSICAPDYSVTLKSIGESVRTLTNSVELAHTPVAGSVNVTFTPAQNITYKVIGKKVVFDSPPSVGTQIQVSYQY